MKIKSNRDTFLKGLQAIQSGVSSKAGAMTVLQNFLMETEQDALKVIFTDLEMSVKHYISVTTEKEGSITLPLKKFIDILHVLGGENEMTISVDKNDKATIKAGKSKFTLKGIPKSEYPVMPDIGEENSFKLPAVKLSEYISKTIFSASTESERQFLNGLLFKYEKKTLSIVATDGRRLALFSDSPKGLKSGFKVIVPSKVLNEIVKFINLSDFDEKTEVEVNLSSNQIAFKFNKTLFVSKLIEGSYPDYEQIIPKSSEVTVELDSEKLLDLTKKALVCTNEKTGTVKYQFKKGFLSVSSSSVNMEFEDEMDIDYNDRDFEISFKPKYMVDVLKTIKGKILFKVNSSSLPVLIRPKNDSSFLYIVMPLKG